MLINFGIEAYTIEGNLPDQEMLKKQQQHPDYESFRLARSPIEAWFKQVASPQLPEKIQNAILQLRSRVDVWDFHSNMSAQQWHFDYTNPRYKDYEPVEQALFVLGGRAPTDVLDPIEVADHKDLIELLKRQPERFPYKSYAPGTFIWSPNGLFAHRRGAGCEPSRRVATEWARVFLG